MKVKFERKVLLWVVSGCWLTTEKNDKKKHDEYYRIIFREPLPLFLTFSADDVLLNLVLSHTFSHISTQVETQLDHLEDDVEEKGRTKEGRKAFGEAEKELPIQAEFLLLLELAAK